MKRLLIELSKSQGTEYERGDKLLIGKSIKALPIGERLKLASELVKIPTEGLDLTTLEVQAQVEECKSRILADIAKLSAYAETLEEVVELQKNMNQKFKQSKEYESLSKEMWRSATEDQDTIWKMLQIMEKETL